MIVSANKQLENAFQSLLPKRGSGNYAFARFLETKLIRELCSENGISIPGWQVYGVSTDESSERIITGDRAVELREDKSDNILLLIDPEASLSGMDGIYSAALEITEQEFFKAANDLALSATKRDCRKLVKDAVIKARKIGRQNTVSPWEEFSFYISVASRFEDFGKNVASIGLWPIQFNDKPDEADLDNSHRLVERLLLATGSAKTPAMRVSGLSLKEPTAEQQKDLEEFVRRSASKSWRHAVAELSDRPTLWLNNIKPGLFDTDVLQSLEIIKWRARSDSKPAAWSGLCMSDLHDGMLRIAINPIPASAKERSKLEVRWKSVPEGLRPGVIEYSVSVIAGDDVLAEQRIVHAAKDQKAKFTEDDFAELEDGSTFEAKIVVRVIGNENIEPVSTEDFILTIGQETKGGMKGGTGKETRSLVEAFATLNQEEFAQAAQALHTTGVKTDKKGFLIAKGGQKSFRVRRPKIYSEIESNWSSKDGEIGRWVVTVGPDGLRLGQPEFMPIDQGATPANIWNRIQTNSAAFCKNYCSNLDNERKQSLLACVYKNSKIADEYVNAWVAAFESANTAVLLANTLEVKSISGRSIGIIILPMHAIRVAWHYAYDSLVAHAVYEDGVTGRSVEDLFAQITGANYPFLLPGLNEGGHFVFADMLGFFFPGMLDSADPEPKASLAMLARAMSDENLDMTPSLGLSTSQFLGKEIRRFI